MRLSEIKRGHAYHHETLGTVFVVGPHPHDGCALVVMYHDEAEDEQKFVLAIPEELEHEVTGHPIMVTYFPAYPPTLTNEVRQVLSLPAHDLHAMACAYRRAGHEITDTLGAEHAFVLDRLLRIALANPNNYLTKMREDLAAAINGTPK